MSLVVKAAQVPSEDDVDVRVWRAVVAQYCCDEMEEAWEARVINFGERDGETNEPALNVYECNIWPEGPIWTEYPIRFCPFCGEAVELDVVEVGG